MYYVYLLINPIDKQIFYVGYGQNDRCEQHFRRFLKGKKDLNPIKFGILRKINEAGLKPIVKIFKSNLTQSKAVELEIKLIKKYGRIFNNTGILSNMTEGGDGRSGINQSEEAKAKISKANKNNPKCAYWKGKHLSESTKSKLRDKFKDIPRPKEVIDKIKLQKGWKHSNEAKDKMKLAKEEKMQLIEITNLDTGETFLIRRIKDFCTENNLKKSKFRKLLKVNGTYKNYKLSRTTLRPSKYKSHGKAKTK